MKPILVFLALVLVLDEVHGSIARSKPNPLRRENGCYEDDVGHLIAAEEKFFLGRCIKAICKRNGAILYIGCIKISSSSCVRSAYNMSLLFPKCCPQLKCAGRIQP